MRLAVSSCLLGNKVRYDGTAKTNNFLLKQLSKFCDFEGVCPEDLAFGTPRPTIRIDISHERGNSKRRAINNANSEDVTDTLLLAVKHEIERLKRLPISGIILKSKSPSCGIDTCQYFCDGAVVDRGQGLFAAAIQSEFPTLPLVEETHLDNDDLRDNFLQHLFAFGALHRLIKNIKNISQLNNFNENNYYLLQSKDDSANAALSHILLNHDKLSIQEIMALYREKFIKTIAVQSTKTNRIHSITQLLSSFKDELTIDEQRVASELLERYRDNMNSLVSLTGYIRQLAEKYQKGSISRQSLLNPYPEQLALRSNEIS